MAQNVTVAGATYSAVPSVELPKQGGGTAAFFDVSDTTAAASDVASGKYFYTASGVKTAGTSSGGGGGGSVTQDEQGYIVLPNTGGGGGGGESWNWMGKNPTKIDEWTESLAFDEIGADSWTWSTSSNTLRDSNQAYTPPKSITLDLEEYDYYFIMRSLVHYDYGGWTPKSAITAMANCAINLTYGTLNNLTAFETGVPSACSILYPAPSGNYCYYADASGVKSYANPNYGVTVNTNMNVSADSLSNVTPTCTFKKQGISIRGNNIYFNSTAYSNVDFENSYVTIVFEIWRVDSGTTPPSKGYIMLAEALNDGLGGE